MVLKVVEELYFNKCSIFYDAIKDIIRHTTNKNKINYTTLLMDLQKVVHKETVFLEGGFIFLVPKVVAMKAQYVKTRGKI